MTSDLIYHPHDHTYTYRPTGEKVNAECLDEFAQKKLDEALARLASVLAKELTNGSWPKVIFCGTLALRKNWAVAHSNNSGTFRGIGASGVRCVPLTDTVWVAGLERALVRGQSEHSIQARPSSLIGGLSHLATETRRPALFRE